MKCVAWKFSLLALLAVALTSCTTKPIPQLEYMPDMYRQLSVHAQEGDPLAPAGVGMRQPVPGTVPRDYDPYHIGAADTLAAHTLVNPLPPTMDILMTGRKYYEIYCAVCHGARGDGLGYIVPKFTMPPVLFSDKVRAWPDGRIYHVITMGQGLMPSYATQLLAEQRWAVIHYLRALQRAASPTPQDLQAAQQSTVTLQSDLPDTGRAERWPKQ